MTEEKGLDRFKRPLSEGKENYHRSTLRTEKGDGPNLGDAA